MLWAEAKQMAALDTYAAEHKLKLQKFPLLDKCEEKWCAVSLSPSHLGAVTVTVTVGSARILLFWSRFSELHRWRGEAGVCTWLVLKSTPGPPVDYPDRTSTRPGSG
jgi:hypothetical protein